MEKPNTIKGLAGRDPIGAVVSIGVKDKNRGFPTETDRWHIVQPRDDAGVRPLHPGFQSFNAAPPEKRKVLRGNLVHASQTACFEHHLKAQVLRGAHPNKRPACIGDGVHATRWEGGDPDDFMNIKCLNELCEYRLTTPPKCKPFMRMLFRLRWPDGVALPTPLVKFTSGSWNTTANFLGFFEYMHSTAKELGIENYTFFGFPFLLTLHRQTKASSRSAFPVVTISPEEDPVSFFMRQRAQIRELAGSVPCETLTDQSQQDVDLVYEDVKALTVPAIGGSS